MTAQERIEDQATDKYAKSVETRARLAFYRSSHENSATWWTLQPVVFLVHPSHPSDQEMIKAIEAPLATFEATPGEMAAAQYASEMITAHGTIASFVIKGGALDDFLEECIGIYAQRGCKMLRATSHDEDSNRRVSRIVDMFTSRSLNSIRMISYAQVGLASGMDWKELAEMLPGPPSDAETMEDPTGVGDLQTLPDFSTGSNRKAAVASYCDHWNREHGKCSEASLARAASVDPADLAKWKAGSLPESSAKKQRIEDALKENQPPIRPELRRE